MKISRFEHDGVTRVGVLVEDDAIRLLATDVTIFELLAAAPNKREQLVTRRADTLVRGEDVLWLAPIVPPSVRDFISFEEHIEGMVKPSGNPVKQEWYEEPSCYYSNPAAVCGPFDDVPLPPGCEVFDFELEVAAVIGNPGSNLTLAEAGAHIAAYTIFNDWSARDIQRRELAGVHGPVKAKDSASTLGPVLVTADELEPVSQRRPAGPRTAGFAERRAVRQRYARESGLLVRADARVRLARNAAGDRRRDRLGDLWVGLPRRDLGPPWPPGSTAAEGRRRGRNDCSGDRHNPKPRSGRTSRASDRRRGHARAISSRAQLVSRPRARVRPTSRCRRRRAAPRR